MLAFVLLACLLATAKSSTPLERLRERINERPQSLSQTLAEQTLSSMSEREQNQMAWKIEHNRLRKEKGLEEANRIHNERVLKNLERANRLQEMRVQSGHSSVPINCSAPPLNPTQALNEKWDILNDGEYVITTRSDKVYHVDPNGISADEEFTFMGIRIPYSLLGPGGVGRQISFTDLCPSHKSNVHPNAQRAHLWGIDPDVWERHNGTRIYVNLPVAEGLHPLWVWVNGFWSSFPEYIRLLRYVITSGSCVRMIDYHPGDHSFDYVTEYLTILQQRAKDVTFAINLAKAENQLPAGSSFFAGRLDTTKIVLSGHSYGGLITTSLAGGNSLLGIERNTDITHIVAMDPTSSFMPYSDMLNINVPYIGFFSQYVVAFQGIVRLHNAVQNSFNHGYMIENSVHQQYQIQDPIMSEIVRETGDVVNSFGWHVPGYYYPDYAIPDVCSPFNTASFVNLQDMYNVITFFLQGFVDAVFHAKRSALNYFTPLGNAVLQTASRLKAPFIHYGPEKVGNLEWLGAETAVQLNRGEDFYFASSSWSISSYNSYLYYTAEVDCDAPCLFCGTQGTYSNGQPSIQIIQCPLEMLEGQ